MSTNTNETDNVKKAQAINPTFFDGLANGFLGMFGLGDLYDVSGKLRDVSSDAQSSLQNSMNSLIFANNNSIQAQAQLDANIVKLITQQKAEVDETINYYNLLSKNSLYKICLYIGFYNNIFYVNSLKLVFKIFT